jgi:hypothetical protein
MAARFENELSWVNNRIGTHWKKVSKLAHADIFT